VDTAENILYLATIINPQLRDLPNIPDAEKPKFERILREEYNKMRPATQVRFEDTQMSQSMRRLYRNQHTAAHMSRGDEVERYMREVVDYQMDPFEWWFQRRKTYPTLSKMAARVLAILPTSVPCERAFAAAGRVFTKVCYFHF